MKIKYITKSDSFINGKLTKYSRLNGNALLSLYSYLFGSEEYRNMPAIYKVIIVSTVAHDSNFKMYHCLLDCNTRIFDFSYAKPLQDDLYSVLKDAWNMDINKINIDYSKIEMDKTPFIINMNMDSIEEKFYFTIFNIDALIVDLL